MMGLCGKGNLEYFGETSAKYFSLGTRHFVPSIVWCDQRRDVCRSTQI